MRQLVKEIQGASDENQRQKELFYLRNTGRNVGISKTTKRVVNQMVWWGVNSDGL